MCFLFLFFSSKCLWVFVHRLFCSERIYYPCSYVSSGTIILLLWLWVLLMELQKPSFKHLCLLVPHDHSEFAEITLSYDYLLLSSSPCLIPNLELSCTCLLNFVLGFIATPKHHIAVPVLNIYIYIYICIYLNRSPDVIKLPT